MAYVTSNPPRKVVASGIDNSQAGNIWMYTSADAIATVVAANYFTNAADLGMAVNDLVFVIDTATPLVSSTRVTAVASTGSTCSTGVTIGNT